MQNTRTAMTRMVKVVFQYRHQTETDTLYMTQMEFLNLSKRLFEKIGILKINSIKYDLTMVQTIEIHFLGDQEVIV